MKIPAGSVLQTDRMHLQGLAQQQDHTTVGSVTIHLFSDLQGGPSSRGGQRIGARLQEELNDLLVAELRGHVERHGIFHFHLRSMAVGTAAHTTWGVRIAEAMPV